MESAKKTSKKCMELGFRLDDPLQQLTQAEAGRAEVLRVDGSTGQYRERTKVGVEPQSKLDIEHIGNI